jgi:hypothetical protein
MKTALDIYVESIGGDKTDTTYELCKLLEKDQIAKAYATAQIDQFFNRNMEKSLNYYYFKTYEQGTED